MPTFSTIVQRAVLAAALLIPMASATARHRGQDDCRCAATGGAVTGRVVDDRGHPIVRARVIAETTGASVGYVPSTVSNARGYFRLVLPPGEYLVFAGKIEAGYPDTLSDLYRGAVKYKRVDVSANKVTSGVFLRLGPKLGRVAGKIEDAVTGKAVTDAKIQVWAANMQERLSSIEPDNNGRFVFVAPPGNFLVRVLAPGYEQVELGGVDSDLHPNLRVPPGAIKRTTIRLSSIRRQGASSSGL